MSNDNSTRNSSTYERNILHPATAKWLTENGYDYEHEINMPFHGRADFVARKDDKLIVIEVKEQPSNHLIRQVNDYRTQIDADEMWVAIPRYQENDSHVPMIKARKVGIIWLDVEPPIKHSGGLHYAITRTYAKQMTLVLIASEYPLDLAREIIEYHTGNESCPMFDLAMLFHFTHHSPKVASFINEYVKDYPGWAEWWDHVQDLLNIFTEMYFLPKLMGVDITEKDRN